MLDPYAILRRGLMCMDPEKAHRLAIATLKSRVFPARKIEDRFLRTAVFGKTFSNPLGLAAGFDKDAEAITPLLNLGFGFVEVGTVTPLPQEGNPKPRVFRDVQNESVINRLGFPGRGIKPFTRRLISFCRKKESGILGVNIGINKDAASPVDDYRRCFEQAAPFVDYIAVNVSSPNTVGLRNLQAKEKLEELLSTLLKQRKEMGFVTPLLLKISPDLDEAQSADIAEVALHVKIDGLIVSNTTVSRPKALAAALKEEKGGLSGKLIEPLSTEMIARFYRLTSGNIPIIGVGGVSSGADAYRKIRAGASLVQIYTALIYQGPGVIPRILSELSALLQKDGFKNVAEAVGAGNMGTKAVA